MFGPSSFVIYPYFVDGICLGSVLFAFIYIYIYMNLYFVLSNLRCSFECHLCFQAFVHDPLINWRLFNFTEVPQMTNTGNMHAPVVSGDEPAPGIELPHPQRGTREREILQVFFA